MQTRIKTASKPRIRTTIACQIRAGHEQIGSKREKRQHIAGKEHDKKCRKRTGKGHTQRKRAVPCDTAPILFRPVPIKGPSANLTYPNPDRR